MRRRHLFLTAFAGLLAWTAPALAQQQQAAPQQAAPAGAHELTIGLTQYPATLNPLGESMVAKSWVNFMATRPISAFDLDWNLVCFLCTELPTLENGRAQIETRPDGTRGMAVRVTLNANAKWGDGVPLTTEDVVFSWEVGRHPQSGTAAPEFYRRIDRIEVVDANTFVAHFTEIAYDYNNFMDFFVIPAHIERPIFQQDPATYKDRTAYLTNPTNPGLWFGPYRLSEISPGTSLTYERNQYWYGTAPHYDRIVVRIIENTAALEANLVSGSINYISAELGVSLDQALAFGRRHQDYDVEFRPGLTYEHINVNLDNPVLRDRRVRQALLYGIDRETLVRQLFEGRQPVAHSFVNPLDRAAYNEDIPHYNYDPNKARQLLDEAGYTVIRDGVRQNAAGQRLSFDLATTAGNRVREQVEQVLQSQWRRIGVEIRIKNDPARTFFGETTRRRQFDLGMWAWTSTPESVSSAFQLLHSSQIPNEANNWSGNNRTGYHNPDMDRLIEQIRGELDPARRNQIWAEIQRIYLTDLPVLPLYFRADPAIIPRSIEGIRISGHAFVSTLWVENWRPRQ
jgi:peptide/nickel transport system substrate-binding protein